MKDLLFEDLIRELAKVRKQELKVKNKSPQQLRQESIDKLVVWINQQTPQSIKEIEFDGSLNRTKVTVEADVNKRAITAEAMRIFMEYQDELRLKGLLPKKIRGAKSQAVINTDWDINVSVILLN